MLSEEMLNRWGWVVMMLKRDLGDDTVRISFEDLTRRVVVRLFGGCIGKAFNEGEHVWLKVEFYDYAKPDYDLYRLLSGEFNRFSKWVKKPRG